MSNVKIPAVVIVTTVLVFLALFYGCNNERTLIRPNVILISLDTLRADFLGCYGHPTVRSPVIDMLSRKGILCSDHHVNSNWTLPSHVSILTSQYASDHRIVYENLLLPDESQTLAESFKGSGYRTGAFYSIRYLGPDLNIGQGFDHMDLYDWVDDADPQRVRNWTASDSSKPFFLFLHTFESHAPYGGYREYRQTSPGGTLRDLKSFDLFTRQYESGQADAAWMDFREGALLMLLGYLKGDDRHEQEIMKKHEIMIDAQLRLWKGVEEFPMTDDLDPWFDSDHYGPDVQALIENYSKRVETTDRSMMRLLEMLCETGCSGNTIICITSDHGEAFFERDRVYGHGGNRMDTVDPVLIADSSFHYEEIAVPLIFWSSDGRRNEKEDGILSGLTSSLDIMPSLLERAGVPLPAGMDGCTVFDLDLQDRFTIVENQRTNKRALITGRWKLITGPDSAQLYDREADPSEMKDVADHNPDDLMRLKAEFDAWSIGRKLAFTPEGDPIDPDLRRHLQMLGYIHEP